MIMTMASLAKGRGSGAEMRVETKQHPGQSVFEISTRGKSKRAEVNQFDQSR